MKKCRASELSRISLNQDQEGRERDHSPQTSERSKQQERELFCLARGDASGSKGCNEGRGNAASPSGRLPHRIPPQTWGAVSGLQSCPPWAAPGGKRWTTWPRSLEGALLPGRPRMPEGELGPRGLPGPAGAQGSSHSRAPGPLHQHWWTRQ